MAEITSEAKLRVSVEGEKEVKDLNAAFQKPGKTSGVSAKAIGLPQQALRQAKQLTMPRAV